MFKKRNLQFLIYSSKAIIRLFFISLFSSQVWAVKLELVAQTTLPHKMSFKKTAVGGLSGLYFDKNSQLIYAISDDRGNVNEPRFYRFRINPSIKDFRIEPDSVELLHVNPTELSHPKLSLFRSQTRSAYPVLDLEGISMVPWGDLLITNEGDMNHKPRVEPQLLDVKSDGTIFKSLEVPSQFLPEKIGVQTKGVQNNAAFEGLTANPNGKQWLVGCEAPLLQDDRKFVRFIEYVSPEAWVIKPARQWAYPFINESSTIALKAREHIRLPDSEKTNDTAPMLLQRGISELLFIDEKQFLVLERGLELSTQGLKFTNELYLSEISNEATDVSSWPKIAENSSLKPLKRVLLLDFAMINHDSIKLIMDNFEGLTLGPILADGRQSLLVVSDDNFSKNQQTVFLMFALTK